MRAGVRVSCQAACADAAAQVTLPEEKEGDRCGNGAEQLGETCYLLRPGIIAEVTRANSAHNCQIQRVGV